jgi:hypothetical protein
MTQLSTPSRSCPGAPIVPKSGRRRAAGFALAVALVAMVVFGETWAIEHAPMLIDQCSPMLSSEMARVFDDGCSDSGAPIAIVH